MDLSRIASSSSNPPVKKALTESTAQRVPLPADKLGQALRPRLERFQRKIDSRLEHIKKDNASTPEQLKAFEAVQKKFHAMMGRFNHIVADGNAEGVLDHVLAHMHEAIDAAINVGQTSVAKSPAARPSGDSVIDPQTGKIDTLA